MAITLVGTPKTGGVTNGGNVTLTFSTRPSTGDVTIVCGGFPSSGTPGPSAGYSYTEAIKYTSGKPYCGVWYKVQGATTDTNVVCMGNGNSADAVAYVAFVIRGVDNTTPLDQTPVGVGPTASTNPNCGSITTQTDGAWVFAFAASSVRDTSVTTPSGYSTIYSATADDNNDITAAGAYLEIASHGAENPASFTGWSSGTWYAMTVAFKPYVAPAERRIFITHV